MGDGTTGGFSCSDQLSSPDSTDVLRGNSVAVGSRGLGPASTRRTSSVAEVWSGRANRNRAVKVGVRSPHSKRLM